MRIGMIAPLWETVPPSGYGGIERIVDLLVRRLMARGHDVILFATGDSTCPAQLAWTEPVALRPLGHDSWSSQASEAVHLAHAFARRGTLDLYHNHMGPMGVAFALATGLPTVTTLHGPLLDPARRFYLSVPNHHYAAISHAQRLSAPELQPISTIYNGIETSTYGLGRRQDYLLFLGRISPEKGCHLAIEVARGCGLPLVIAGKVDPYDQAYFAAEIAPHLDDDRVRFIGEVAGAAKREVLQSALAVLHLVQWAEPFGLVMVEALASGVPVIARPLGSIPEIITHGRTGYIVDTVEEAIAAVRMLPALDPVECRREAIERFDADQMVTGYEALYQHLLASRQPA